MTHPLELPKEFITGERLRGEAKERTGAGEVQPKSRVCGEIEKEGGFFMHPPYREGVGYTFVRFGPLAIPSSPPIEFACAIGKGDGSDVGDGILFKIAVIDEDGAETVLAEKTHKRHCWIPLKVDLSRFAGKTIYLKLIADVGPAGDSSGDWANWGDLSFNSMEPVLVTTLHETPVQLTYEPGERTDSSITPEQLRKAKKAVLHFEGAGIQCSGQYVSTCKLNGISIGRLPACGGDEVNGVFGSGSIPLDAKAIAALGKKNVFEIDNPGSDYFKLKNVRIDAVLKDGRRISSKTTTTAYTQPPGWKYAEGIGCPGRRADSD